MEGIFSEVFDCSDSNLSITCEIFRPQELKKDTYSSLNRCFHRQSRTEKHLTSEIKCISFFVLKYIMQCKA